MHCDSIVCILHHFVFKIALFVKLILCKRKNNPVSDHLLHAVYVEASELLPLKRDRKTKLKRTNVGFYLNEWMNKYIFEYKWQRTSTNNILRYIVEYYICIQYEQLCSWQKVRTWINTPSNFTKVDSFGGWLFTYLLFETKNNSRMTKNHRKESNEKLKWGEKNYA